MPWTTPKTWATNDLVTAGDLNLHLRDNLNELKTPPTSLYTNMAASYATTSTSFVDIDATNLNLTVSTAGGRLMVALLGTTSASAGSTMFVDFMIDGVRIGDATNGLIRSAISVGVYPLTMMYWTGALAAGNHTFKVQWKMSANTGYLYQVQFWAREVS